MSQLYVSETGEVVVVDITCISRRKDPAHENQVLRTLMQMLLEYMARHPLVSQVE